MVDTVRTVTALQTLLADNASGNISPQDLRDFLVTALGVYGSVSVFEGSTSQTSLGTTAVKLTCFDTDGTSSGVTPSHSGDSLTITVAGDYCIQFQASFSGTASSQVRFRLRTGAVEESFGCVHTLDGSGNAASVSFVVPDITLAASDILTVYVETDDGGGSDQITVLDAQFSARMIG